MIIRTWNITEITGYTPISTFYEDLSIADNFGVDAITDTYERVVEQWLPDFKMFTEFVMALNWKIWEHYETNERLARVYNTLWERADLLAQETFKGEELAYFFRTTD